VDKLHGRDCIDIVTGALEAGYRIIDTAQSYGNEEEVGKALAQSRISRSEIFVTTKISRGSENPGSIEEAYDSALNSTHRLGLSYVDLFLIHSPGDDAGARSATWLALEQLVREGLVKDIGVSNYGVQHILEMKEYATIYPPKVNQIEVRSDMSHTTRQ
jgi:diketogulonate reductase-like aldo/keto reductase